MGFMGLVPMNLGGGKGGGGRFMAEGAAAGLGPFQYSKGR